MNTVQFFAVLEAMENNAAAEQRIIQEEQERLSKRRTGHDLADRLRSLREMDGGDRRARNLRIRG